MVDEIFVILTSCVLDFTSNILPLQLWEKSFDSPDGVNVSVGGFSSVIKREDDYQLQLEVTRDNLHILDKVGEYALS